MALRPQHSRVGDGCRLLGTVLIATHLFLSAWLIVQFEGQYTEGQPAPTKVKALVVIDKEQTLIDVEMENATSFLLYMAFRDFDEPVNSSQSDSSNSSSNNDKQQPSSESKEEVEWLENGRILTVSALVILCISECLVIAGIPFRATVRAALLTGVVACFLIVMPATYVLDLAGDSDDEDEGENQEALADETFVAKTEKGSMAHENTSVEQSMLWTGVRFEMMFSGYDLGLVEPENYAAVRDNVPNENETDALSYVEFQSHLDLKYGKNIPTMFLIPVLWFFFPAKPKPTAILDGQKGEQEE
ncbi:MAG: hypothetical protein GWP25_00505 [Euryarchaeota archaeon]|nr:hypothetical protein [Euryarchaeota archaeon]